MQRTVATIFTLSLLILPLHAWGQASLESPAAGSFVSGLGDIHGWKCTAGNLTFTIDNGPPGLLIYGASRADTQGVCGKINNGFITQFNWNLAGNGPHTIRVYDNGVLFAQAGFSVTTLGTEYLTGQSATCNTSIAGQNVTLSWQQNQQNFVITGASGGGGGADLRDLLGRWRFVYTIISTFVNNYDFQRIVTTSTGVTGIVGINLDDGSPFAAARVKDLISEPFPFDFALLNPRTIICDFFAFNKTGRDTVAGIYVLTSKSGGTCGSIIGSPDPMTGTRISASAATEGKAAAVAGEDLKLEEAVGRAKSFTSPGISDEIIRELVDMLQ